jgi:hypothetical protein
LGVALVAAASADRGPPCSTDEPTVIDREVAPAERGPAQSERGPALRVVANSLPEVADPVADPVAALAARRAGADAKALRRALSRIEELLDE